MCLNQDRNIQIRLMVLRNLKLALKSDKDKQAILDQAPIIKATNLVALNLTACSINNPFITYSL